jgi:hypothetical protein
VNRGCVLGQVLADGAPVTAALAADLGIGSARGVQGAKRRTFIQDSVSRIMSRTNRRVTPTRGRAGTQLAETDLHVRSYGERRVSLYADNRTPFEVLTEHRTQAAVAA